MWREKLQKIFIRMAIKVFTIIACIKWTSSMLKLKLFFLRIAHEAFSKSNWPIGTAMSVQIMHCMNLNFFSPQHGNSESLEWKLVWWKFFFGFNCYFCWLMAHAWYVGQGRVGCRLYHIIHAHMHLQRSNRNATVERSITWCSDFPTNVQY